MTTLEAPAILGVRASGRDLTSDALRWLRGIGVRQVRIACGLIMFFYIFSHFFNHALGNISYPLMEAWLRLHVWWWRIPLVKGLDYEFCDNVGNVKNVYIAPFYDVGNAYLENHQLGSVAHAAGVGVRIDVGWLGLIERTTLRFDVAKTLNSSAPAQFWFGITHPF